jgi:dienelactone hydrolase
MADLQRASVSLNFRGRDFLGQLVTPSPAYGLRPLIMVVHNFQGLKHFDVHVAEYLARLGYAGFAIDLYGDLVTPEHRLWSADAQVWDQNVKKAFKAMVELEADRPFFRGLLQAWLDVGLRQTGADPTVRPAAVGYCLGGEAVLEAMRGGLDLAGVVSFHGLLQTGEGAGPENVGVKRPPSKPCEDHHNTGTIVQIENGANDHLVTLENRQRFFEEMDRAGIDWIFNDYANAPHGFALPTTLGAPGHLHEAADRRSTLAMLNLFREIFPMVEQSPVAFNAAGTRIPG